MKKLLNCTINYLKKLVKEAKRSMSAKKEASQILRNIFGNNLDETDYQLWLVKELGLHDVNELITLLDTSFEDERRGGKLLALTERQNIYNFWLLNSVVSVHRSNDRHIMKIPKSNLILQVKDLQDVNLKTIIGKNSSEKLQAHRKLASKPYRALHKLYCEIYDAISFSSFVRCKPFYITPPTSTEMEMCLCSKCLNPHCLYQAIRKECKELNLPSSLSEFLCQDIKCVKDNKINYYYISCIQELCPNMCTIINIEEKLKDNGKFFGDKQLSYYLFERK